MNNFGCVLAIYCISLEAIVFSAVLYILDALSENVNYYIPCIESCMVNGILQLKVKACKGIQLLNQHFIDYIKWGQPYM